MANFKYISVDTEGYAPNLLGISVSDPALNAMYFPLGHKENVNIDQETEDALRESLTSVSYRIMHNAAHDLIALPYLFDRPFLCTMIMAHMVDENVLSKALDYQHKYWCGGGGKQRDPLMQSIIDTHGWDWIPFELVNAYASVDAQITMELAQHLIPLYEAEFGPLWDD